MKNKLFLFALTVGMTGCASPNYLDQRYNLPRADLKEEPIEASHNPPAAPPMDVVNSDPTGQTPPSVPGVQDVVTGRWEFTTPPTVTRVERKNVDLSQFSLYSGRPAATDTPFVVITVSPPDGDKGSQAEADGGKYKIAGTRKYILNGNIASEWTGRTADGSAFCELILTRPGGEGDLCHAMAIAKNEEQRKLSLQILAGITWKSTITPPTIP